MHRASIALTVVIAGLIAGCGSSHKTTTLSSDQQQVTSTLRTYLKAQAAGNGQTACAQLTPAAQKELVSVVKSAAGGLIPGSPSCVQVVGLASAAAGSGLMSALAHAKIAHVQVNGTTATAQVNAKGFPAQHVTLEKTGGTWKITGVPNPNLG